MSERALTGPRIMTKEIPAYIASWDALSGQFPGQNGWKNVPIVFPNAQAIYYETYLDLSGYNLDDLTIIPTLMELQDPNTYFVTNPAGNTDSLWLVDVLSMERLDPVETITDFAVFNDYPGSPRSNTNYEQLPMVNVRFTTARTNIGNTTLQTIASAGSLGSGEPTTVQKLWCYRFICATADVPYVGGENLSVPATRFVLAAQIVKESELAHMMRLKRSYELSTQ